MAGFRMLGAGCRIRVSGCRVSDAGYPLPQLSLKNTDAPVTYLAALYFVISKVTFGVKLDLAFLRSNDERNFQIDAY